MAPTPSASPHPTSVPYYRARTPTSGAKGDRSAKCMRVTARSRVSNMGTFTLTTRVLILLYRYVSNRKSKCRVYYVDGCDRSGYRRSQRVPKPHHIQTTCGRFEEHIRSVRGLSKTNRAGASHHEPLFASASTSPCCLRGWLRDTPVPRSPVLQNELTKVYSLGVSR